MGKVQPQVQAEDRMSEVETHDSRTADQNKLLWAMLTDVSDQIKWRVNGRLVDMDKDDWKDVLTAALRKHQRVADGVDGGIVFLGMRTHRMNKQEFSDLIELIRAFGAERGVRWTDEMPTEEIDT